MTAIGITASGTHPAAGHAPASHRPRATRPGGRCGASCRPGAELRDHRRRIRARVARRGGAGGLIRRPSPCRTATRCGRSPKRSHRARTRATSSMRSSDSTRSHGRRDLGGPAAGDPGGILGGSLTASLYDGRGERTPRRPSPPRRSARADALRRPAGAAARRPQRQREHASGSRRGRRRHPGCCRARPARGEPLPRPGVHRAAGGLRRLPRVRAHARPDLGGQRFQRGASARAAGLRRTGPHGIRLRSDVLDVSAAHPRHRRLVDEGSPRPRLHRRRRERSIPGRATPHPTSSSSARPTTPPEPR